MRRRLVSRIAPLLVVGLVVGAIAAGVSGCDRRVDERIKVEVHQLVLSEGEAAAGSASRLVMFGRRALPAMEAALHTADERGRKNLILAMRRLGDAEAIPLLLHVATHDPASDVRREAEWTLQTFAKGDDERGTRARDALRSLAELRHTEEAG